MSTSLNKRWYALHTRSRHEKCVGNFLGKTGIHVYVPLRRVRSYRLDRNVTVDFPAIPGYIFVYCTLTAEIRALIKRTSGVLNLVTNAGSPAIIPDAQIESLRILLGRSDAPDPHPYFAVGSRVRVIRGPFKDIEGVLVRLDERRFRLVVQVDHVNQALCVDMDARCVEPLEERSYALT